MGALTVLKREKYILGVNFDGGVYLWETPNIIENGLTEHAYLETGYRYIRHACMNKDSSTIALISEIGNQKNSLIILKVQGNEITVVKQLVGGYRMCEFNAENKLIAIRRNFYHPETNELLVPNDVIEGAG